MGSGIVPVLTYRNYIGEFDYDPEDDLFVGEVKDISDTVYFEGRSIDELKQSLARAVDHYLDFCAKLGREPDKPYSGNFVLRVDPKAHLAMAKAARLAGESLNTWAGNVLHRSALRVLRARRAA
jgi:predicted HicB family RNase H-like nuclease